VWELGITALGVVFVVTAVVVLTYKVLDRP
jgi:hypothetical protein